MHFASRFPAALFVCLVCLVSFAIAPGAASGQAPPPQAQAGPDALLMQRGEQLSTEGKHAEAAAAYLELTTKYPQSPVAVEASFRAGYASYLGGDLDAAVAAFKKVIEAKNAPPEFAELALSMTPQVLAAKASKLPLQDPERKHSLEAAVQQFEVYLTRFANSDEAEAATFGKALALYQLERYQDSAAALKGNLQKFPQSATIQDSQFLLALTLGTISNVAMTAKAADAATETNYENAEKLLRDIIAKRQHLALVNDAQFQIGELLAARARFTKDKAKQVDLLAKAMEAYRAVLTKDLVLQAQKARIAQFADLRNKAGAAGDRAQFQKLKRVVEREQEKLAQIEGRGDETVTAKVKTGQIFFQLGRMDEARVLFTFLEQNALVEDPEAKKQLLYLITMSYAVQGVIDRAEERYKAFQTAYPADPIAENLQLVMGAMFLNADPKKNSPDRAINYFKEGIALYPKGKNLGPLVIAQAQALIQLNRLEEALQMLQSTLANNPSDELAVQAQSFLATIYAKTGKTPEALKTYKLVRDKFPGTPQAEDATFRVGQLLAGTDPKAGVGELQAFLKKFPDSAQFTEALFTLGTAQASAGQKDAALATFRDLAVKYPQSAPAPFSFFERAKLLSADQKYDECVKVMREFTQQFPESPSLYQAYEFIAQIQTSQSKSADAIATYEEFVAKRPRDEASAEALLKLSALYKAYTDAQGLYLAIDETRRTEWRKGIEKSTAAAERVLTDFPESEAVALALKNLLDVQVLQQAVKLKTEQDIEKYFQDLAKKFAGKPGTQAKIQFALAAFTFEKDRAKALQQMSAVYKPELRFAPEDLDLYGQALIEAKRHDEAIAVYEKLAKDFPAPAMGTPARKIGEAQAIALAGLGKALQEKGDKTAGAAKFAELEKLYAWSPKMLEVNYGIALELHDKKQDDDAMTRLLQVIKAQKAPADLRAKSMLLLGKIQETNRRYDEAINNYIKISAYYSGVPKIAAEGLWLGAQLMERQATGEIAESTPKPALPAKRTLAKKK